MKRRSDSDVIKLIKELETAASSPKTWDVWLKRNGSQDAKLEFPLGELFNPAIEGFCLAWRLTGKITTASFLDTDRFDAQGLEGKAVVTTDIVAALLAYRELPQYRRQLSF